MNAVTRELEPQSGISERARRLIANPSCLIAGSWIEGEGSEIADVDPSTEEVLARFRYASERQVNLATESARAAFDEGTWSRLAPKARQKHLHRVVEILEANAGALEEIIVAEIGAPIRLARSAQVGQAIRDLSWFADAAGEEPERVLPLYKVGDISVSSVIRHEPAGSVAAITAYNYPLLILSWKLGAALAAGCTLTVAPSPQSTLSVLAFMRLLDEADLPPGTVNFLIGGAEVGRQLVQSDRAEVISFTGSLKVGKEIAATAGQMMKKLILELGGKSANILLPGCDVEAVTMPSLLTFCRNSGQNCGATTRILVQKRDIDAFCSFARELWPQIVVDDPWKPESDMGPLISSSHREAVEQVIRKATEDGAEIIAGGGRPPHLDRGYFMNPALIGGLSNAAEINQEEIFGPVASLIPYEDEADAIEIANDSIYGLTANIWGDLQRAQSIAPRLRTGTVTLNGGGALRPDGPWGGYCGSGIGRERGHHGINEFLEVKHVQWPA